jgi:hypothetical protein
MKTEEADNEEIVNGMSSKEEKDTGAVYTWVV